MQKSTTIILYKGASSVVEFDFTEFEFNSGFVVFTMKDCRSDEVLKEEQFTEKKIYTVIFNDEFTATLDTDNQVYKYDLMYHINGERYAQCLPSEIKVIDTIGGVVNE